MAVIDNGGTVADDHFKGVTNNGSGVSYGAAQVNNANQSNQEKSGWLDNLKSFGRSAKEYAGYFAAELKPAYANNADNIQTTLDVAGMVPVIGEPADLLNGVISLGRKDYAEAGLSAAAAIPFWGTAATGAKWSKKALDGADALADVTKKADEVVDAGKKIMKKRGMPRERMIEAGKPIPEGMLNPQVHHELPQEFRQKFEAVGIDIDDTEYLSWVSGGPEGNHQKLSRGYNDMWRTFLEDPKNRTKENILNKLYEFRTGGRFK